MAFGIAVAVWLLAELVVYLRRRLQSRGVRVQEYRTLVVFVVLLVVGSVAANAFKVGLPVLGLHPRATFEAAAVAFVAVGVVIRIWAIATLGRYFRSTVHVQEGHQVVQSGPYRVVRHPSYTGLLGIFAGIALSYANVASFVVFMACGCAALLQRIRVEERVLLRELGSPYADYATGKPRLIPYVW